MLHGTNYAVPSSKTPVYKLGLEYSNERVKDKTFINLRNYYLEHSFSVKACDKLVFGGEFELDPRATLLQKYNFGLTWNCCKSVNVGLKHESTSKEFLQLGKFFLIFHNHVSAAQQVGSEFVLDWQSRQVEAKLGVSHQLNDDSAIKLKVNHHGYLDVALKHRVSSLATLGLVSGFNLKAAVADARTTNIPFGLSLDLKL